MNAAADLSPWILLIVLIIICELGKALHGARKQLAASQAHLARVSADRDLADAALRRAINGQGIPAKDQSGQPITLQAWQPESKPS